MGSVRAWAATGLSEGTAATSAVGAVGAVGAVMKAVEEVCYGARRRR
jgi:hypothetical protein